MTNTCFNTRSGIRTLYVMGALLFGCVAIAISGGLQAWADSQSSDEEQISHLIKTTWEKPDQPMSVAPIVLSGIYAVAGWSEKARGGRALLKKGDGRWRVVLCAGDGIRTASGLVAAGLSSETAEALATQIAEREAELPPDQVAKFSLFEGVVDMGGGEHHPPH